MQPIDPKILAGVLDQEFVVNSPERAGRKLRPAERPARFDDKAKLYARAVILLVLLQKERQKPAYVLVQSEFERIFLPASAPDGQPEFAALREAMAGVNRLIEEKKPMTWARQWFADVGIIVENPADAAVFSAYWVDLFVTVAKALDEFRPVRPASH